MNKIKKYLYIVSIVFIFVLAFLLRIKSYLLARPLWHDECSLAISILKRDIFGFFQPLEHSQKAPVFFMILTKIITYFGGVRELALRFIPFLSALLSVIVFFFLSKKLFTNKFTVLVANLLFAVNYQLIYYSQEFKQYSFDVLLFLCSILFFGKLNLDKISYKNIFILSLMSLILILASFPCAFIIGAYILYCFLNKTNLKKIIAYGLPLIIICCLYYIVFLQNVQTNEIADYFGYWTNGFLTFNINSILNVFRENFNYFFGPNNFALIGFVLFIWGIFLFIKAKNKTNNIILLSFLFVLLASMMQIYPIWQRTALYLLPILILLISKPVDLISLNNKFKSSLIILLFLICFYNYNFEYLKLFLNKNTFSRGEFPNEIATYMFSHINNKDIIIVNNASVSEFEYYSSFYTFNNTVLKEKLPKKFDEKEYFQLLNNLPKGYYCFYLPYDYSHTKVVPIIDSWAKTKKIIYEFKKNRSVFLKVYVE